jgi:lipid II:glycine glycyltransferase (peptidoglycan interpeptide bridge formation enzyme)
MLVDVTDEEESIFNRMRESTRKQIRRDLRSGLRFREGRGHEVETFRNLMLQVCRRRGVSPRPSQENFFQRLWDIYPKKYIRLFVVEQEEKMVSAVFAFLFQIRLSSCRFYL